ncbi:hypothetical protein P0D69_45890 [Paraburkholderia sediminicola]|uniref:acyltransferase family protein n=1 Tax=Paraburkholderia sediminicola TaxID=458836 RepID=UPI0038B8281E
MGYLFLGGMLLKLLKGKVPITLPRAAVAFVFYAVTATFATGGAQYFSAIIAAITVPYVVIAIAESKSLKLPNAGKYGDFSYGIYLYAMPIQQSLVYYLGTGIGLVAEIVAAFSLTLPCAILSWHLIEKNALTFKPSARLADDNGSVRAPT